MIKFIACDDSAVGELVSGQYFQSIEFERGDELASLLKGRVIPSQVGVLVTVQRDGGVYLVSNRSEKATVRFIVFDIEQSDMFSQLSDSDALFAFQKVLRFARKWWAGGQGFTNAEKIFSESTKAAIFPFRVESRPYRISVEREPWRERLGKRGYAGRFLLAYRAGRTGVSSNGEDVELTNFKKVFEGFESALASAGGAAAVAAENAQLNGQLMVTGLGAPIGSGSGTLFRSFHDWMAALTIQQRGFVEAPLQGAHRIEGSAGTGKTLSLILKAVYSLREAQSLSIPRHVVFITHSDATKEAISEVLSVVDAEHNFQSRLKDLSPQSLKVTTLTQLCAETLRHAISDSEFIDRDAMESKDMQRLYIAEAIEVAVDQDLPAHSRFMTPAFVELMKGESSWNLSQLFQHEISVLIKGRAAENFEAYRDAVPVRYGLPAHSPADKAFAFAVFKRYRDTLAVGGQFDTDDVVLTAIGQLDTPIWKRRRARDGFDAIFIDETHLFNINELHLFHYFTKGEEMFPIAYSIDKSQAVGDPGWSTSEMESAVSKAPDSAVSAVSPQSVSVGTIFRCSPEIVDLAFCVVSSGATLFTNFENPIGHSNSAFTSAEEAMSRKPTFIESLNEEALIEDAFAQADALQREMGVRRGDVLICVLDQSLLRKLTDFAGEHRRPIKVVSRRGDVQAVEQAVAGGMYVLAHADYVGGLEFQAVVLVGIDDGRVPPVLGAEADSAKHFLTYSAHNRLYVAITRAKYRVVILGEAARGISRILAPAMKAGLIATQEG